MDAQPCSVHRVHAQEAVGGAGEEQQRHQVLVHGLAQCTIIHKDNTVNIQITAFFSFGAHVL